MKKVYLVIREYDYEGGDIVGVFSSYEKANECVEHCVGFKLDSINDKAKSDNVELFISEYKLNEVDNSVDLFLGETKWKN